MAREYILLEIDAPDDPLRYWSGDEDSDLADGLLSEGEGPYTAVEVLNVEPLATTRSNAMPTLTVHLCLQPTDAGYEVLRTAEQALDGLVRLTDDRTLQTEHWRFWGRTRRRSLQAGLFTLELVHVAARFLEDDPNPAVWNAERDKGFEFLQATAERLDATTWPD